MNRHHTGLRLIQPTSLPPLARRSSGTWFAAMGLVLCACRPAAQGPSAPSRQTAVHPVKAAAAPSTPQSSSKAPASLPQAPPTAETPSLRLSTLPADTMAVARIRAQDGFQAPLREALDTDPASLKRSLPLALRLPLSMLAMRPSQTLPFSQRPMALVWDPQQRAFWIWDQQDLSLAARNAIEQALGGTTSFAPPYWIHQRPDDPLEYFVHTRARWLIACPKAFAPALRQWLKDTKADKPGSLSWAPSPQDSSPLLLRWRYPQLLESAPFAALGVIGELEFQPQTGVTINGAPRSNPE